MSFEETIQKHYPDARQGDVRYYRFVYDKLLQLTGNDLNNIDKLTLGDISRLFLTRSGNLGSIATFHRCRDFLVALYEDLVLDGYRLITSLNQMKVLSYADVAVFDEGLASFASLDQALEAAHHITKESIPPLQTIIILAWCGLSTAQIADFEKDDVTVSTHTINNVPISDKALEILLRQKYSESYALFGTQKTYKQAPSLYLLPGKHGKLNANRISQILKEFNKVAIEQGRYFSIVHLNRSGICSRLYEIEKQRPLTSKDYFDITDLGRYCSITAVNKYYDMWKRQHCL